MPTGMKKTKRNHIARQKRVTNPPMDENRTTTASPTTLPTPPMASAEVQAINGMAALPAASSAVVKTAGASLPSFSLAGLPDMIPFVPPLDAAAAQPQTNQLLYNTIPSAPLYLPPPVPHHPTEEELQGEIEDGKDKNAFEDRVLAAPAKKKRASGCYKQWSAPITLELLQQGGLVRAYILISFLLGTHFFPSSSPHKQQPTLATSGGPRMCAVTAMGRRKGRRIGGSLLRRWSIRRGGRWRATRAASTLIIHNIHLTILFYSFTHLLLIKTLPSLSFYLFSTLPHHALQTLPPLLS